MRAPVARFLHRQRSGRPSDPVYGDGDDRGSVATAICERVVVGRVRSAVVCVCACVCVRCVRATDVVVCRAAGRYVNAHNSELLLLHLYFISPFFRASEIINANRVLPTAVRACGDFNLSRSRFFFFFIRFVRSDLVFFRKNKKKFSPRSRRAGTCVGARSTRVPPSPCPSRGIREYFDRIPATHTHRRAGPTPPTRFLPVRIACRVRTA